MNRDQLLVQSVWPEWQLTDQLGSGQYGVVWKARKQGFAGDSFAAVKVVTIEVENNRNGFTPEQTDSYLASIAHNYAREIKMMESVKGYSNIVNIEDYSVIKNSGGQPWFVLIRMELLTPLYEYLENQEITDEKLIRIGTDLCKALEICASKKIVHRDIKPANVFVNDAGVFKLGDFGVARQILSSTSQTRIGTPDFMAPEIYNNSLHSTDFEDAQRADIYSLGMLLYWIANGRRMPFVRQSGLITSEQISDAFTRRMSGEKLPGPVNASKGLKEVLLKACSYHSADRYKSAEYFRESLEGLKRLPDSVKPGVSKSHKRLIIIPLICLAVLFGIAVYLVFSPIPPVPPPPTPTSIITPTLTPVNTPSPSPTSDPSETRVPAETPAVWPVIATEGVATRLRPLDEKGRRASYLGPDREYASGGWFRPDQVSSALAVFQEGDYILIDLEYPSVGRRCVYFAASDVTDPPETAVCPEGVPVTVTETTQPRLGPGRKYDTNQLSVLHDGDTVMALLEWNEWVLTEYQDERGLVRAWIPAVSIR